MNLSFVSLSTPDYACLDERALIELMCRERDEEAFAEIFRRFQKQIYRFALHLSGSHVVAEDATQETFMFLIYQAARYDATRGTLAAYLYGIARNHTLRLIDKRHQYVVFDSVDSKSGKKLDEASADDFIVSDDPHTVAARNEQIAQVQAAVLALPVHYREVVVLCDLHETSYEEAARILECPVGTIRSRLNRARALLAERLRPRPEVETNRVLHARLCV